MKKFHKRAAVFLTAATLAGLPAGAFFYSSPGRLYGQIMQKWNHQKKAARKMLIFQMDQKLKFMQIQWNRQRKMQELT